MRFVHAVTKQGEKLTTIFSTHAHGGIMLESDYDKTRDKLATLRKDHPDAFKTLETIAKDPNQRSDKIPAADLQKLDKSLEEIGGDRYSGTLNVLKNWSETRYGPNHRPALMLEVETGGGPKAVHPRFVAETIGQVQELIRKSPDWEEKLRIMTKDRNLVRIKDFNDGNLLQEVGLSTNGHAIEGYTAAVIQQHLRQ